MVGDPNRQRRVAWVFYISRRYHEHAAGNRLWASLSARRDHGRFDRNRHSWGTIENFGLRRAFQNRPTIHDPIDLPQIDTLAAFSDMVGELVIVCACAPALPKMPPIPR